MIKVTITVSQPSKPWPITTSKKFDTWSEAFDEARNVVFMFEPGAKVTLVVFDTIT